MTMDSPATEGTQFPVSLECYDTWARRAYLLYKWLKAYNCAKSTITCRCHL